MRLEYLLSNTALHMPEQTAISGSEATLTYKELDSLCSYICNTLQKKGVAQNDRIAIWSENSVVSIAAIQGILRCGCTYVPLSTAANANWIRDRLEDLEICLLVTDARHAAMVKKVSSIPTVTTDFLWESWCDSDADKVLPNIEYSDDRSLAYILSTSGSTGRPKGVCIEHRQALAFVSWSTNLTGLTNADNVAGQTSIDFDLSIFDIFATFATGATLKLVPALLSSIPQKYKTFLLREKITCLYTVPTLWRRLLSGAVFANNDVAQNLRLVLFAGEVFPVEPLKKLRTQLPLTRIINMYGPTETNVCASYELPSELASWTEGDIPIGKECCGNRLWAEHTSGRIARIGETGQLYVEGPTVMRGYWKSKETQGVFATGDLVELLPSGLFRFVGRQDYQIKYKGIRLEPEEMELRFIFHSGFPAAGVFFEKERGKERLLAIVERKAGLSVSQEDVLHLFAESHPYGRMVDAVVFVEALPLLDNGKVNRHLFSTRFHQG